MDNPLEKLLDNYDYFQICNNNTEINDNEMLVRDINRDNKYSNSSLSMLIDKSFNSSLYINNVNNKLSMKDILLYSLPSFGKTSSFLMIKYI